VLISIVFFSYWFKTRAGIDFSKSYSLSDYIPFKYLKRNDIIVAPNPGMILNETFDSISVFDDWGNLWMREENSVTKGYDKNGINNSRCLLIRSNSEKSWVCSYYGLIEVHKGDRFSFKGVTKLKGETISAYAGVAAFDKNRKAITWNYIQEKVGKKNLWSNFAGSFSISDDGINFIRFRLSGIGIGEFRFDDIRFRKE